MSTKGMQRPLPSGRLFSVYPSIALVFLFTVTAFSFGDLMEIIPLFAPLVASPVFHFFHEIHDLLALGVALFAAYKYSARLGVAAITLFLAVHIPYAIVVFPEEIPELLRIVFIGFVALFGVWLIHQLHKSENVVRQIQERLQLQVERMPIGLIVWDMNFRVQSWNPAAEKIFGFSVEEAVGKHPYDLIVTKEAQPQVDDIWRRLLEGDMTSRSVNENTTKDGRTITCDWSNTPLRAEDGRVMGVLSMVQDITESKIDEERIAHLTAVLKAIRNVNQLITREKDRESLIKKSCELLVQRQGYERAWILLLDKNINCVAAVSSGFDENTSAFLKQLETGDYPICVRELLGQDQAFIAYDRPGKQHRGCLLADEHSSRGVFRCKLEYGGKLYGVFGVALPSGLVFDKEEQGLFLELCGDIAFALGNIEAAEQRKQAEEATRRTEENFRRSIDDSPLGIRIVSAEGDLLYANRAILDIYGYSGAEELRNAPVKQRYTPDSYAEFRARREKRQRGEYIPSNYEISIVRKDGGIRHLSVFRKEVIWDGKTQFQAIYQDVTERKQAEENLRESEELYRSLFENMLNGFAYCKMLYDQNQPQDFIYLNVNSAFEALTGLKDVVGKKVSEVIPGIQKSDPELLEIYGRVAFTGIPERFEIYMQTLKMWFSISVYSPEKEYFVAVFDVITERKKAEAEIAKFKEISDLATYGITMLDDQHLITYVNRICAQLHGYSSSELLGRPCTILVPDNQLEIVDRLFKIAETTGGFTNEEVTHRRKDDTTFPTLMTGLTVKDDSGKPLYTSVIVMDITERKKMQEQLMAQDRLASIGQLVSGVAHEINNPLTGVIGFSELLLKRKDLADDVKADLKIVNDEAMRTSKIVKNLLTFARKQPEGKAPVDINEQIQRVLDLRDHEQKVNNINVATHLASDLPQVMGNASQLQQVFFNIVINAEFFMLEAHQKGNLTITTERKGDIVRASITDDGPGISEENMRSIFNPFFTTKEVGKGTGLGLSICHGIITEHGGKIYAESELAKGATFIIELPIKQAEMNPE